MWYGVPFARQRRPIIGVLRMCLLLPGSFDCVCCPAPPPPPSGAEFVEAPKVPKFFWSKIIGAEGTKVFFDGLMGPGENLAQHLKGGEVWVHGGGGGWFGNPTPHPPPPSGAKLLKGAGIRTICATRRAGDNNYSVGRGRVVSVPL